VAHARRILLVAPCEMSSGEAVTLCAVGADLERSGSECMVLASVGVRPYFAAALRADVRVFGRSLADNQTLWNETVAAFRPDAIVFGDYPLLFFGSGSVPLADEAWVAGLERNGCALVTLDHLGYAQGPRIVAFGPPHMTFGMEVTRSLPAAMQVLLPCPINDPGRAGLKGVPFRLLPDRVIPAAERQSERARHLDDDSDALVVHSTPAWSVHLARELGLPHHGYLSELLAGWFAPMKRRVVAVSVSATGLLDTRGTGSFRTVNLPPMAPAEFERLLACADLVLSDNAVSVSLGRAVALGSRCALLANSRSISQFDGSDAAGARIARRMEQQRPGAIFPWDVFPIWNADDLEHLGFGADHAFRRCVARLETFDGAATQAVLRELLDGGAPASALELARRSYIEHVETLPAPAAALAEAIA
jgi:hypothetical protein